MRIFLILPNYQQSDSLSVLVFENNAWVFSDYGSAISPLKLAKGCSRGIPLPMLESLPPEKSSNFILGQLLRRNQNAGLLLATCLAGKDITNRTVFLTAIFEFSEEEKENFPFSIPDGIDFALKSSEEYKISHDQKKSLLDAIERTNNLKNGENKDAFQSMYERFIRQNQFKHFTSIPFRNFTPNIPDSEKGGRNGNKNPPFKNTQPNSSNVSKKIGIGVVMLAGIALLGLGVHHLLKQENQQISETDKKIETTNQDHPMLPTNGEENETKASQ